MKHRYFLIILLLLLPASAVAESIRLVIPGPTEPYKIRNPFVEDLLRMIFKKQNMHLDIVYAKDKFTQGRALKELNNSGIIDVTWSVTTNEREQELSAVRIPIYQGFIGWRVFIINKDKQKIFKQVEHLIDLHDLVAVQRFDWPDYDIFVENNLTVEGSLPNLQMYKAIESGLADYFPRSVLEATRDLNSVNSSVLAIEKTLLLKYPSSYYFFVGKNNKALAQTIATGFELMLADGSYQLLFQQYFGQALKGLQLEQRKIIYLNNSLFPIEDKP